MWDDHADVKEVFHSDLKVNEIVTIVKIHEFICRGLPTGH